jgi:hypothetical protein
VSVLAPPIIVVVFVLLTLVLSWWVAGRMKRSIERNPGATLVSRKFTVTSRCVAHLQGLSAEPVLLKLEDGILRYQVDDRRMAPVAVAPGESAAALREAGAAVSAQFGQRWVALVRPEPPDGLMVNRLS